MSKMSKRPGETAMEWYERIQSERPERAEELRRMAETMERLLPRMIEELRQTFLVEDLFDE